MPTPTSTRRPRARPADHSLGTARHDPDHDPDHDPLIPAMDWRAGAAFAAAIGMSTQAGEALIRDALVLRHRLPRVWARVVTGEVPVWRARRIAQAVYAQPADVADYLDEHVAGVAERVGVVTVDRLIDEAMLRLHAEERELAQLEQLDATYVTVHEASINHTGIAEATIRADWKDLDDFDTTLTDVAHRLEPVHAGEPFAARRARAVGVLADPARAAALLAGTDEADLPAPRYGIHLVVHTTPDTLTGGNEVARLETTTGGAGRAVLAQQVATWCGQAGQNIKVTEVIDLTRPVTVDRYEVGDRLRTRMTLTHPTCVFPWCTRSARACDADHVIPHKQRRTHLRRQPRPLMPATSPPEDQNRLDLPDPRHRHLALDRPPRPDLPPQPQRHPNDHRTHRRLNRRLRDGAGAPERSCGSWSVIRQSVRGGVRA